MKVLLSIVFLLEILLVQGQDFYVPASVVIPALNISTVHDLHNKTQSVVHTGWNNPLLNKTGAGNFNQTNTNCDLIVGRIRAMDHRLFKQVFWKSRKWWTGREMLVRYPHDLHGNYGRHETISAIRVFNQFSDGVDSTAQIVSGGVWKRFVNIRLTSSLGRGFRFLVVIYGR